MQIASQTWALREIRPAFSQDLEDQPKKWRANANQFSSFSTVAPWALVLKRSVHPRCGRKPVTSNWPSANLSQGRSHFHVDLVFGPVLNEVDGIVRHCLAIDDHLADAGFDSVRIFYDDAPGALP